MSKNKDFKSKWLPVLIPVIAAVVVVSGLAISGNVTKGKDAAVSQQTQTTEAQTQVQPDTKVTLVAVGDNLIHNTLIDAGLQEDGTRDYNSFYENISPYVKQADIACIDNETLLGGSEFEYSGYPCFNTPWEVGSHAYQ